MPFYEYECTACKFYVEALQKISDPPMKKCPSCKKQTLKKLVSAPVFRLKGGGWYETDFKSDQDKKRNLAGEDKDTSNSDAKTESPDSKPESKPADSKPADAKPSAPESKSEKSAEKSSSSRSKQRSKQPVAKAKSKAKAPAKKK